MRCILFAMDPISMVFYGVVCGLLSLAAPGLGGRVPRFAIGVVVGIGGAFVLGYVRQNLIGPY